MQQLSHGGISVRSDDRERFNRLRREISERAGRNIPKVKLFETMVTTMEAIIAGEDNDAVVAATWAALTGEAGE
jgi:hypothetical protein